MKKIKSFVTENILYFALVQAMLAVIGSLYYSDIKGYVPCTLCWYQRIFLYPLVLIILVGIIRVDKKLHWYVLPMAIGGWAIALYHILIQNNIITEAITPCSIVASCRLNQVEYFGFLTIPVMAFMSFTIIIISMLIYKKYQ